MLVITGSAILVELLSTGVVVGVVCIPLLTTGVDVSPFVLSTGVVSGLSSVHDVKLVVATIPAVAIAPKTINLFFILITS